MKWISLLLQLLSLRKHVVDSQAILESTQAIAARGKRYAASFLLLCLAALFLFSGFLLAVIELGLQIDRGAYGYSGLMVSSTLLLGLCLAFGVGSYVLGRAESAPPPPPPGSDRAERIKDLLEEFAVSFLKNLMAKQDGGKRPGGVSGNSPWGE